MKAMPSDLTKITAAICDIRDDMRLIRKAIEQYVDRDPLTLMSQAMQARAQAQAGLPMPPDAYDPATAGTDAPAIDPPAPEPIAPGHTRPQAVLDPSDWRHR
jgi:hypothetical protein